MGVGSYDPTGVVSVGCVGGGRVARRQNGRCWLVVGVWAASAAMCTLGPSWHVL